MNKSNLSYGLNLAKNARSKPTPARRNPIFGGDDDSGDEALDSSKGGPQATAISELDDGDFSSSKPSTSTSHPGRKPSHKACTEDAPPSPISKARTAQRSTFSDLSSSLESRKHREAAEALDPSIYDYDAVYDSIKPNKKAAPEDVQRKPKYMKSLIASAAVRKRDALIAEEKKIAREREEEGEEFDDKEKFVTEAYKKLQEDNRRIEEEERQKEEAEAKKNKSSGMTAFYKQLLDQGDQRHAEVMRAAEQRAKVGAIDDAPTEDEPIQTEADLAQEINKKGGSVAINEDGQVVDKRELLKGGLNLGAKKKSQVRRDDGTRLNRQDNHGQSNAFVGAGGKNAMRERQSRMLEAQLEQSLKRSMVDEEEERQKVERAAKSRKTETDILSAKDRYLARKKAAEEAKRGGHAEEP